MEARPVPARIQTRMARQIVDTLKTICGHDINFIDPERSLRQGINMRP